MGTFVLALLATLSWTAPTSVAHDCGPGVEPASERQTHVVLRLRGQYPAYYVGIEDSPEWANLIAWCRPDTDTVLVAMPGDTLTATSAPGFWHAITARNSRGWNCWNLIWR